MPGNAGLKDQQMVLEFVRDNIHNFGGDAGNVTLMGHSSGGMSVSLHCIAESSRGLFQRAVFLGGSCVTNWPQLDWTKKLATALNFGGDINDESEILKFLEAADCLKMSEAGMGLATEDDARDHDVVFPFGPKIEPYVNDSTFISSSPFDLMKSAWSKDIDVLIGGTIDEGMPFKLFKNRELKFLNEIPRDLSQKLNKEQKEKFAKEIEDFYLTRFPNEKEAWEKVS